MATVTIFSEEEIITYQSESSPEWHSSLEDLSFIEDILPEKEKLEQFFFTL